MYRVGRLPSPKRTVLLFDNIYNIKYEIKHKFAHAEV